MKLNVDPGKRVQSFIGLAFGFVKDRADQNASLHSFWCSQRTGPLVGKDHVIGDYMLRGLWAYWMPNRMPNREDISKSSARSVEILVAQVVLLRITLFQYSASFYTVWAWDSNGNEREKHRWTPSDHVSRLTRRLSRRRGHHSDCHSHKPHMGIFRLPRPIRRLYRVAGFASLRPVCSACVRRRKRSLVPTLQQGQQRGSL